MVSDIRHMLKSQGGAGGQHQLVSVTRPPSVTEYTLTVAQAHNRSATTATNRPNISSWHLAYLANHLPRRQGPASDVAS